VRHLPLEILDVFHVLCTHAIFHFKRSCTFLHVGHTSVCSVLGSLSPTLYEIRLPIVEEDRRRQNVDLAPADFSSLVLSQFIYEPHKVYLVYLKIVFLLVASILNLFHTHKLLFYLLRKSLFLCLGQSLQIELGLFFRLLGCNCPLVHFLFSKTLLKCFSLRVHINYRSVQTVVV
jgi:hypothetical protein